MGNTDLQKKKDYVTEHDVNRLLNYLKIKEYYRAYIVLLCMTRFKIKFRRLSKMTWDDAIKMAGDDDELKAELIHIRDTMLMKHKSISGHSRDKVVQLTTQTMNRTLYDAQKFIGIYDTERLTTRIFVHQKVKDGVKVWCRIKNEKRPTQLTDEEKPNHIYIVKYIHHDDNISKLLKEKKIGITNNIRARKSGLTIGTVEVECLRLWKTDVKETKKIERMLHNRLKERNIKGEWFYDDNEDLIGIVEKEMEFLKEMGIKCEEVNVNKFESKVQKV